jgi:hypothetical protein
MKLYKTVPGLMMIAHDTAYLLISKVGTHIIWMAFNEFDGLRFSSAYLLRPEQPIMTGGYNALFDPPVDKR